VKRDCPHCHKSMGGRFVRWRKLANMDPSRNCRLCGGEIEFRLYPEEVGARILTILVVIATGYWAKQRGGGYLTILLTVALVLVAAYLVVHLRLRNQQRFKKGRNAA